MARTATPMGANATARSRHYACLYPAPPDHGRVSGAPDAAVKGKEGQAGSVPGDSEHMDAPPQAADRAGARVNC